MKALPNNNKPATHFIEVFHNNITTNQQDAKAENRPEFIHNIEDLYLELDKSITYELKTIAIFKIRFK